MKNYALFSEQGRFIGYTNFKPVNGLFKEMPDSFDPVLQVYVGDYETGGLKNVQDLEVKDYREANVDKKWKVFETEINNEIGTLITQKMGITLHKQLNAIMETLFLNKDNLKLSENFEMIYNSIQAIRHNHNSALKTYEEAPKADVIHQDEERIFFEEYTQQQLNINDEPVQIKVLENEEE
jgi:hypothetical protein